MMNRESQNFHIMIKQGITWYNLKQYKPTHISFKTCIAYSNQSTTSCMASSDADSQ